MRAVDRSPTAPSLDGSVLRHRLEHLIGRQELFLRGHRRGHRFAPTDLARAHTAWFGVGVTTAGRLSEGLPLDVLGLVYAQELTRRTLGLARSLVLVADSNACAAGANPLAVRRRGLETERRLREVCACLGFPVDVRLASTLGRADALPGFSRVRALPPYVAHQLAQTEYLRRRGASVKIGWAWSSALHDERYFDDLHAREYGPGLTCLYTGGGTTLDPRRPRACPYVCSDPAARLRLRPDEDLERKLGTASRLGAQRYRRLLGKLTRAHCRLLHAPRPRSSTAALQDLLEQLSCPS